MTVKDVAAPVWQDDAACLDFAPRTFFLGRGEGHLAQTARNICATCPVRAPCLAEALLSGERFGIRATFAEKELRELRRLLGISEDEPAELAAARQRRLAAASA